MKKKKTRRQQTIRCPYCGAIADLRPASEIYGDPNAEGVLFVCRNYPGCKSYVHVYPGTNRPTVIFGICALLHIGSLI